MREHLDRYSASGVTTLAPAILGDGDLRETLRAIAPA
jgi:hypothetical protein